MFTIKCHDYMVPKPVGHLWRHTLLLSLPIINFCHCRTRRCMKSELLIRGVGGECGNVISHHHPEKPREDLKRNLKYRIFRRASAFHRSAFSPLIDWNIACHKTESERTLRPAAGFYAACLRSLKYIWQCVPTGRNGCNMCNGKNGFSVNQTPNRWRRQKKGYFFLRFCFLLFYFLFVNQ